MASEDEIATLRRMTALDPADPVYTDSLLGGMIDDLGMQAAAAQIWHEKAAAAAGLVDTSESGSSRSLSQLRTGYLDMASAVNPDPVTGGSFTIEIDRV
jgi:hypothetical protein